MSSELATEKCAWHTGWTEHREATELHTRQVTGRTSHEFRPGQIQRAQ